MKKIVGYDHEFGGENADVKGVVGGQLAVEGSDLVAEVSVKAKMPLAKIVDPAMRVVDSLIDKVDAWIPGDQKELAAKFKAEARDELVKALSEQAE
jgi:hypothetical protein